MIAISCFSAQVIDFWLLFFLLTTSLNIAMHIIIDRVYQREKILLKTGASFLKQVGGGQKPPPQAKQPQQQLAFGPSAPHNKTYGPMANDLFVKAAKSSSAGSSGERVRIFFDCFITTSFC